MNKAQLIVNLERGAAQERANAHKALGKAEAFDAAREALIACVEDVPTIEGLRAEATNPTDVEEDVDNGAE